MNNENRTIWIIVAIVVGVLLCCCVVVVGAAVAGLLTTVPISREAGIGRIEERTEQVNTVGPGPILAVDSFAGDVVVRSGESGEIRVIATKRALNTSSLNRIDVAVTEQDNGVLVETSKRGIATGSISVELEVVVPADAHLELSTGAGNVEIDNVEGEISAHTGAGNVRVEGAAGPVALDTGAGNVTYEGEPQSRCTFETGAGNITLHLPDDVNVGIELDTGVGNINLGGFDVEGDTSGTDVEGVIGTGEQATIEAQTGAGNIRLVRR